MKSRRALLLTLTALLACGLMAGCSDDNAGGEPELRQWPLTGQEGYPAGDTRQAITVKIENTSSGHPQLGVGDADIVVQELVEGGLTRLAAMFHSQYTTKAGPVRSMRETDIGLVLPTAGTLAASGGSGSTMAAVDAAGVPTAVEERDPGFSRDDSRPSPYDLMLDVSQLASTLPPSPPTTPYFTFGDLAPDAPGNPASEVELRWPSAESTFTYDAASGQWVKTDLADPTGFSFTNVIALTLPIRFDGATDAAGTPVPTMVTTGSGTGLVASGEKVYQVKWAKASDSAPWTFTYQPQSASEPATQFTIPPGRTWLALLPQDGGSVTATPAG